MTGKDFREAVGGLRTIQDPHDPTKQRDVVANMNKFKKIKEHLRVLARSSPEDKYLLVTGIQDCDGVVAVTGDGTNDAPALTKADVGFSMGITGTDVAKGASDIILLDDNFSSIVVALRYGRNVYDNVRKFLQFQLTVNVVAMFIVFLGSVILKDSPLNAVQMLWVNLIMDTFAALALATEPPQDDILQRQPYKKNGAIVTQVMWRNVFGHAIYQAVVIIMIIFLGQYTLVQPYENWTAAEVEGVTYRNPFYATDLTYSDASKKFWEEQDNVQFQEQDMKNFVCWIAEMHDHKKYKNACDNADFDYSAFTCEYAKSKQEDPEKYVCNDNDSSGTIHPKDVKSGTATMQQTLFTYIFQTFVFMQVFNQINARKLELGEFNVFSGIFRNWLFSFITILTIGVQMLMVEYLGTFVKCVPLTLDQNIICIGIAAMELLVGVVIKFMPLGWFQCVRLDDAPMSESTEQNSITAMMKRSSTLRKNPKSGDDKFHKLE
jgi:magnesium-transporting ATPase (P-type)